MTPDAIASDRPVREVPAFPGHDVLFQAEGGPLLLHMRNERNDFEVLVAKEKFADLAPLLNSKEAKILTGFWRRRSGFREDGSRRYVWCLVLLDAHTCPVEYAHVA